MRLHQLSITAFGPFVDTVDVDFDELAEGGLFLLTGDTGAGKTSVLDAVCFGLYGDVPGDRHTLGTSAATTPTRSTSRRCGSSSASAGAPSGSPAPPPGTAPAGAAVGRAASRRTSSPRSSGTATGRP